MREARAATATAARPYITAAPFARPLFASARACSSRKAARVSPPVLDTGVNLETREDSGNVHRRITAVDEPEEQVRVHRELERLVEWADGVERRPPHERTGLRHDLAGADECLGQVRMCLPDARRSSSDVLAIPVGPAGGGMLVQRRNDA